MIQNQMTFPMARNSDPDTSHDSAARHTPKLSERRKEVLGIVVSNPGLTQGEIARKYYHRYGNMRPIQACCSTPSKRLPELEKLGHITRGATRKCADTGYNVATWWPA